MESIYIMRAGAPRPTRPKARARFWRSARRAFPLTVSARPARRVPAAAPSRRSSAGADVRPARPVGDGHGDRPGRARPRGRAEGEPTEFERGQLMSAYSATRHLAVELDHFGPERERLRHEVAAARGRRRGGGSRRRSRTAWLAGCSPRPTTRARSARTCACCWPNAASTQASLGDVAGIADRGLRALCDREVSLLPR